MPIADVTFFTAAGQPAFTTETRTGDYVVRHVLGANEPTALEIIAEFTQTRADYARPAANATLTYDNGAGSDVTAYFDDDTDFEDLGGGVQKWKRHWFTLPATWKEPGGTVAYTFPAYVAGVAFGSIFAATGAIANGNYYTINTNATNVAVSDTLMLDLSFVRDQNYHVTFVTPAVYATSGVDVGIYKLLPGYGAFSAVTGTVREWSTGRSVPETLEVDSFLIHEYALADENLVGVLLPQIPAFSPVNSSGYSVDTLSTGLATYPNSADYASMVAAFSRIVIRPSDRLKYAGNIYERRTLVVVAK
jgi:hypothetical protein